MDDRSAAQAASAVDRPGQTAAKSSKKQTAESNVKETIESILVAFVLAFIFRAFVVEAFVIPTGSMAPTLMGAHMRFVCPDCGYRFEVNFPTDRDVEGNDDMAVPKFARVERTGEDRVFSVHCPNCGYKLPRHDPADANNSVTAPPVRYGDRILVLKYLYLFQDPRRWDVVVFKAPYEPMRYDYQQNYIKRMVGKPRESIMILDGDVYVARPGTAGTDLSDYVVQTKPRSVQDALWRIVYDNDFHPRLLPRDVLDASGQSSRREAAWEQPWKVEQGGRGWQLHEAAPGTGPIAPVTGRTLDFNASDGGGAIVFDPAVNRSKYSLTDWLAYDQTASNRGYADVFDEPDSMMPENNVSDLKLAFTYERRSGEGPLTAEVSKLGRTFVAEVYPDHVALRSREQNQTTELGSVNLRLDQGSHRIELMNVDYHVTLRVDDKDVIETTPAQYAPNLPQLLDAFNRGTRLPPPTVRISATGQACTLSHLGLWRDVYYGNRGNQSGSNLPFHASPRDFPANVAHLGADEYFVLGDNSPISGDARYWSERIDLPNENLEVDAGRVPGRFLLGKAFFVYWPAGFRPIDSAPALVPNFGDMRVIH